MMHILAWAFVPVLVILVFGSVLNLSTTKITKR